MSEPVYCGSGRVGLCAMSSQPPFSTTPHFSRARSDKNSGLRPPSWYSESYSYTYQCMQFVYSALSCFLSNSSTSFRISLSRTLRRILSLRSFPKSAASCLASASACDALHISFMTCRACQLTLDVVFQVIQILDL